MTPIAGIPPAARGSHVTISVGQTSNGQAMATRMGSSWEGFWQVPLWEGYGDYAKA